MQLKIYGASDDLIEVEGDIREEFYAKKVGEHVDGLTLTLSRIINGAVEGLDVHVRYERGGVWSVGVSQLDEDVDLPDWGIRLSSNAYTSILELDRIPEDVRLTHEPDDESNY